MLLGLSALVPAALVALAALVAGSGPARATTPPTRARSIEVTRAPARAVAHDRPAQRTVLLAERERGRDCTRCRRVDLDGAAPTHASQQLAKRAPSGGTPSSPVADRRKTLGRSLAARAPPPE